MVYLFIFYITLASTALQATSFSQPSTETGKEKLPLNFKGIVQDVQNNSFEANNISISGQYQRIPFYSKPIDTETSPETNTTFIDLQEIYSLKPKTVNPRDSIEQYNKKSYIEVVVTLNHEQTIEREYLLDLHKKVQCEVQTNAGAIAKELSFEALKELTIEGFDKQIVTPSGKPAEEASLREKQCMKASKVVNELQAEVEKVKDKTMRTRLAEIAESLRDWVGGICK